MSHRNARLTPYGRLLLVQRVAAGMPVAHVAKAMGISRQCAHRWVNRFQEHGRDGLVDRSSRPRSCPTRTPAALEQQVVELRRRERHGQDWIGAELGLAPRTVSRILRRHQVPLLRMCDPLTGELIRSSKLTAHRYERAHPGDLVHVDVKKLGKIPPGGGWKAHGRAMGKTSAHKKARIGYDFVHSAVDDHSRFAYSEVLTDEQGPTCAGFLTRAAAAFAQHGITIAQVITDNHWCYSKSNDVDAALTAIGAEHLFIKAHCPWQNGKVERFNRTIANEWAYRQVFTTNDERTAALVPWLQHYNTVRRHTALGGHPPISRLSPT